MVFILFINDMSCFWDGLIRKLDKDDFTLLKLDKKPNAQEFAIHLKKQNKICTSVQWNAEQLTNQFLKESYQAIEEYNPSKVNQGYDCSTCDPFLILLCEVLNISITHEYNRNTIIYSSTKSRKIIKCSSNTSHFS